MSTKPPVLVDTYPQYPFEITRGEGVYVFDDSGNRYLDMYGGHAVCSLGHCNSRIAEAISRQAEKLFFYSNLTKLSIRDEAAETLVRFADSHLSSLFFCNSGAEANENALKLAVQLTGRSRLVSLKGGWHGRTTMAAAVTDDPKWHAKTPGWTGDVLFLAPNDSQDLQKIDEQCAAVIVEPLQSIGGVYEITNDYLLQLRERTKKSGTLLIFDEVQTGVGRTGAPYVNGHGQAGTNKEVCADMSTSAKSLANGFPIGALLLSPEIASEIQLGDLGSTFGGGPLAMAALQETLTIIQESNLQEHVRDIEMYLRESISQIPLVTEVRGHGCLLGLKLSIEAKQVVGKLRDFNILAGTSGVADVMRLLPPYIIEKEHIDELVTALTKIGEELL
ncbi:MAG: aspartate aminotransferase family protein [Bdellovibrionales bacterium]|nr:aspartate aminotransferase family protein [Bdellovibrionales bacterium]